MAYPKLSGRGHRWYIPVATLVEVQSTSVQDAEVVQPSSARRQESFVPSEPSRPPHSKLVSRRQQSDKQKAETGGSEDVPIEQKTPEELFLPVVGIVNPTVHLDNLSVSASGDTGVQGVALRPAPEIHGTGDTASQRLAGVLWLVDEYAELSALSEQPTHFTSGIVGPGNMNRRGVSMDFDTTVLWLAAWGRRGRHQREELIRDLQRHGELQSKLGSEETTRAWVSHMEKALDSALSGIRIEDKAMTLEQITQAVKSWNHDKCTLTAEGCGDLLSHIDGDKNLTSKLVTLLAGEQGKGNIFTSKSDVSPAWILLNFLRYWTVVGREDRFRPSRYGPRESMRYIERRISSN